MIEEKKTRAADLERKRLITLAVSFLVSLLVFVAVLHIPFSESENEISVEMLDELAEELELTPAIERTEMVAAIEDEPTINTADQIKVVEEEVARQMEETQSTVSLTLSEAEALSHDIRHNPVVLPVAIDDDDNPISFRIVEQLPEFPGGMVEYMKWLTKNLRYPDKAKQQRIQGKVLVQFIVNRDGSVADIKLAQSVDPLLDDEALRVMRIMPKWKPGIQYNKPCRTMIAVPVVFKL